jgi:hypothetical protein
VSAHPGALGESFLREPGGEPIVPQKHPKGRRLRYAPLVFHPAAYFRAAAAALLPRPWRERRSVVDRTLQLTPCPFWRSEGAALSLNGLVAPTDRSRD